MQADENCAHFQWHVVRFSEVINTHHAQEREENERKVTIRVGNLCE